MDCQTSTEDTWYLVQPTFEDHVQLLGKKVIPCNCPGGSGRTIFQFQALKTGQKITHTSLYASQGHIDSNSCSSRATISCIKQPSLVLHCYSQALFFCYTIL